MAFVGDNYIPSDDAIDHLTEPELRTLADRHYYQTSTGEEGGRQSIPHMREFLKMRKRFMQRQPEYIIPPKDDLREMVQRELLELWYARRAVFPDLLYSEAGGLREEDRWEPMMLIANLNLMEMVAHTKIERLTVDQVTGSRTPSEAHILRIVADVPNRFLPQREFSTPAARKSRSAIYAVDYHDPSITTQEITEAQSAREILGPALEMWNAQPPPLNSPLFLYVVRLRNLDYSLERQIQMMTERSLLPHRTQDLQQRRQARRQAQRTTTLTSARQIRMAGERVRVQREREEAIRVARGIDVVVSGRGEELEDYQSQDDVEEAIPAIPEREEDYQSQDDDVDLDLDVLQIPQSEDDVDLDTDT